jgi:hypothetical protein
MIWIPTSESLPDDEECVLIAMEDGEVWTGYTEAGEWFFVSADKVGSNVTHWMRFPDVPFKSPAWVERLSA